MFFFFTILVDEVVHTKRTFPATSPMPEHFKSEKEILHLEIIIYEFGQYHTMDGTSPPSLNLSISDLTVKSCCTGAVIRTLNNILYFSKYLCTHPLIGSKEKTMWAITRVSQRCWRQFWWPFHGKRGLCKCHSQGAGEPVCCSGHTCDISLPTQRSVHRPRSTWAHPPQVWVPDFCRRI